MDNLTEDKGIVRRTETPHQAGADVLFVYRVDGAGKETFHSRIGPGEVFRPLLVDRLRTFVGYLVQADPFSHRFSQRFQHHGQAHTFTLHFRLELEVEDPRALLTRRRRDPLRLLQRDVEHLVGSSVAQLDWQLLEADSRQAPAHALATGRTDHQGRIGETVAQALERRAAELGFRVLNIAVECELDEDAVVEPVEAAKTRAHLVRAEGQAQREQADNRLDELRKHHEIRLGRLQEQSENFHYLSTRILEKFDHALGGVAGQIDDMAGLTEAVEELARLRQNIHGFAWIDSGGGEARGALLPASGGESQRPRALPAGNGWTACQAFLGEAVQHVADLRGEQEEKRGWLACVLNLVATIADEEVTGKDLDQVAEEVGHRFSGSMDSWRTDEQRRFFEALRRPREIRSRILGDGG